MINRRDFRLTNLIIFSLLTLFFFAANVDSKPQSDVPIRLRHGLQGVMVDYLQKVVDDYNAENPSLPVELEYGGDYDTSFDKTFSEPVKEARPHLLMVAETNTAAMQAREGDYIPLYKILKINIADMIPVIRDFYSFKAPYEGKSNLYSLPFNCSAPVLYYNKEAFLKAGLPDKAPKTWEEVEVYARKLKEAGYIGFSTAWPVAYIFEHFGVIHNITYAEPKNGFGEGQAILLINTEPYVRQLNTFVKWQKEGLYSYHGIRAETPEKAFKAQEIGMMFHSANRYVSLKDAGFEIGVGPYPYWASLVNHPYTLNVCGTSIWVLAGHANYEGVKEFLQYLASPAVQAKWHQTTGYLPISMTAYKMTKKTGFYEANPYIYMGVKQLIERERKPDAPGIRLLNYKQVRKNIERAIEDTLQDDISAKESLDKAVDESYDLINGYITP